MTPPIDIRADQLRIVRDVLRRHLPDEVKVWVFGSRATWMTKDSSDLDLALEGDTRIAPRNLSALDAAFEDSDLPFAVDIVDVKRIGERFRRIVTEQRVRLPESDDSCATDWSNGGLFGLLPPGWECSTLGAACERGGGNIQTGPFGSQLHASDYRPVGIPSIMPQNLGDNRVIVDGIARIGDRDASRLQRYLVRKGDIVYSRRGDVEKRALIGPREDGWLCGTGCLRVRLGENGVDPRYVSYYLGHPAVREWIVRHAHGATMPNLNTAILSACPFVVPPIPEQRTIAHVLGTLDDKIELNRRMNATLEAMARALFRSWFVDFDPVRAKMEGRDTGLPKDIADLFPDRLADSELGDIPQGWLVRTLGELCHKPQYGYTASARSQPVGPRFLRITDINKNPWVSWSRVPYCEATDDELSKYRLRKGDVLIARMADPGHGILVEEDVEAVFASYLIRFRPIENRDARFLQYWLKSDAYWQLVRGQAAGTTRVSLNAKVLGLFPLVVPPNGVASAFARVVGALRDRLMLSATEMQLLADLRDTLLPKLVSGQLLVQRNRTGMRA